MQLEEVAVSPHVPNPNFADSLELFDLALEYLIRRELASAASDRSNSSTISCGWRQFPSPCPQSSYTGELPAAKPAIGRTAQADAEAERVDRSFAKEDLDVRLRAGRHGMLWTVDRNVAIWARLLVLEQFDG